MYTKRTLFRLLRARSGMASVLGMLMFIGVLFTCIIPLFLYVNKANSFYDQAVVEMRESDQNREREQIDVYAYPLGNESDQLNVYIKNRCPLSVKIKRVWVNDDNRTCACEIAGMGDGTINLTDVELPLTETKAFYIKVTTARGNAFSSFTNPLYYTSGEGGWGGGVGFAVQVVIKTSEAGTHFYHVNITGPGSFSYEADVVKRPHESSCFTAVTVLGAGDYYVTVKEGQQSIPVTPYPVTVDQSNPSGWVYANDV